MKRRMVKSCVALGVLMATASGTAYAATTSKIANVNTQATIQASQIESYEQLKMEVESFRDSLTANEKEGFDIVWFDPLLNLSQKFEELKDTKKAYIACSEEVFAKFARKLKNFKTYLKNNCADEMKITFIQSKVESMEYHGRLRDESLREKAKLNQSQREALGKFQGKYIADILDKSQIEKYRDVITKLEDVENKYKTGELPSSMDAHSVVQEALGNFVVDYSNQLERDLKRSIQNRVVKFAQLSEIGTDYVNIKKYSLNIYAKLDLLEMAENRLTLDARVKNVFNDVSKDSSAELLSGRDPVSDDLVKCAGRYIKIFNKANIDCTGFKAKLAKNLGLFQESLLKAMERKFDYANWLNVLKAELPSDVYDNILAQFKKTLKEGIAEVYFSTMKSPEFVRDQINLLDDDELRDKLNEAIKPWLVSKIPVVSYGTSEDSIFAARNMYNTTTLAYNKVVDDVCSEITGGNASNYKLTVSEIVPQHESRSFVAPAADKINSICESARETIAKSTVVKKICGTYNDCKASIKNAWSTMKSWNPLV